MMPVPIEQFRWEKRHWATLAQFESHVVSLVRPWWLSGATVHHTYRPTLADWERYGGSYYIDALGRFYRTQVDNGAGWPAGPNLFISSDGIWQGTPITQRGVHAGDCNISHLGIEVVGDYDQVGWPEPIKSLVLGVLAILVRRWQVPVERIVGHRDCLPNKSCPGNAISMPQVRQWVGALVAKPVQEVKVKELQTFKPAKLYRTTAAGVNLRSTPEITASNVKHQIKDTNQELYVSALVEGGTVGPSSPGYNHWLRIAGVGLYVHSSVVQEVPQPAPSTVEHADLVELCQQAQANVEGVIGLKSLQAQLQERVRQVEEGQQKLLSLCVAVADMAKS